MPSIINCCKDCPDRKIVDGVRCHSWCEKYAAEDALNKKRLKETHDYNQAREFTKDTFRRIHKRIRIH